MLKAAKIHVPDLRLARQRAQAARIHEPKRLQALLLEGRMLVHQYGTHEIAPNLAPISSRAIPAPVILTAPSGPVQPDGPIPLAAPRGRTAPASLPARAARIRGR